MAEFRLFQKTPENFYGEIVKLTNITYEKSGSSVTSGVHYYSSQIEYPDSGSSKNISSLTATDTEIKTTPFVCRIGMRKADCVGYRIRKIDKNGNLSETTNQNAYNVTENDGTITINFFNIFENFKTEVDTEDMQTEIYYAACIEFYFEENVSFINVYTNSYNEETGTVTDKYDGDTNVNFSFMTKPLSDVSYFVSIPYWYNGTYANVYDDNESLEIYTYYPSISSDKFKGYYFGNTDSPVENIQSIQPTQITIAQLKSPNNNLLSDSERNALSNGESINKCIWMHYVASRLITPFSQRKIRIIKAY